MRSLPFALVLLTAVFGFAVASHPAIAKDKPKAASAETAAAKLPDPLTRESIRELVSRLDDAEVRALLIKQLDRAAAPAAARKSDDMADMAQSTSAEFALVRQRAGEILASAAEVPAALDEVAVRMTEPREPSLLWIIAGGFLLMLGAGAAVEIAFSRLTRNASQRFEARAADGFTASTVRLVLRTGIGLAHLLAFAVGAIALFFALWQGSEATRFIVVVLFSAVMGVRLFALLARLLLEPQAPRVRLLPFDDRAAGALYWGTARLAVLYAFIRVVVLFFGHFGAPGDTVLLFKILASALFILLMLDTVWKVRADVAELIRGPGEPGHLRRLLGDLWPAIATAYLVALYLSLVYDLLLGNTDTGYAPILSIVLLLVLPLADMLACHVLSAVMQRPSGTGADASSPVAESFEPVLRRAIHIVVLVSGFLMLADLWGLDMFAMAERGIGARVTSALLGIAITTLLAWVLWEVARTAIDRRMQAETVADGKTVSRLRTLLPLLRATLLATILVMALLSILAALGINIVPLLAGASVIGVAIGFGSQTLVRDIVSGAFFLMDDAFRLGEYIEVGDAKGTVEKIGVRAVILRHHRGALNVLPYGEIKRLRNTSRDWMIMKLEFRLAYDTDLKKVKNIIKKVGQEIAADPELNKDLIEPLKSQGVTATDESGLIVRVKYTANPAGGGAYTIRREAFARIIKAFSDAGIKFAERRVTVNVPPGMSADAAAGAAAMGAEASEK
jgi:small-conductance mechanosensitive channel